MILSAVQGHSALITEQLRSLEAARQVPQPKKYQEEGSFLYLGKEYPLHKLIAVGEQDAETLKLELKKFYFNSLKK